MDIGLFIIIMIVLYVVPEILKRFKKRRPYQYPEFPQEREPVEDGMPGSLSQGTKPPPVPYVADEGVAGDEGDPSWKVEPVTAISTGSELRETQGSSYGLDYRAAMQGIVWAEIIAPPVALRRRNTVFKRI